MLTITEFYQLSRKEQYRYIRQKCLYLVSREDPLAQYRLYHSGNFFIEVVHFRHSKTSLVRTFNTSEHLTRYLSQINIRSLPLKQSRVSLSGRWRFNNFNKFPLYLWVALVLEAAGILAICHYWMKLF